MMSDDVWLQSHQPLSTLHFLSLPTSIDIFTFFSSWYSWLQLVTKSIRPSILAQQISTVLLLNSVISQHLNLRQISAILNPNFPFWNEQTVQSPNMSTSERPNTTFDSAIIITGALSDPYHHNDQKDDDYNDHMMVIKRERDFGWARWSRWKCFATRPIARLLFIHHSIVISISRIKSY